MLTTIFFVVYWFVITILQRYFWKHLNFKQN